MIEQIIGELKGGPLAHLPSGHFGANAAWVQLAVSAFNLTRPAADGAGMNKARMVTILTQIIHVPARLATRACQIIAHLPAQRPNRSTKRGISQKETRRLAGWVERLARTQGAVHPADEIASDGSPGRDRRRSGWEITVTIRPGSNTKTWGWRL